MTQIVSNTGPLIALGGINRLDILRELFEGVIVPDSVHSEIMEGGGGFTGLSAYQGCAWIQVRALSSEVDPLLANILDLGEASVICLARELGESCVLMDEKKGRKIARDIYGLKIVGTVRVLLEAKRRGLIADVGTTLNEMRQTGYWFHDSIIERARAEAGEN